MSSSSVSSSPKLAALPVSQPETNDHQQNGHKTPPPLQHPQPKGHLPRKMSIAFAEPTEVRQKERHSLSGATPTTPTTTFVSNPFNNTPTAPRVGYSRDRPRSLSSPPPPPTFLKRVGFDTFDNKDASDFSLTLKAKHKDYNYTRRSRTFLCGTDQNDYSEFALEWLIDELVDDGDEIVCLRVVDKDSKMSSDTSMQERLYRQEARKLLNEIIEKNDEDKAISIVLEFAVGKVHDTIQRMIHIYEPVILIVGTRGRSLGGIQGLLPGSVSKYCLQHSPVPVIVVRPSNKREKKKKKRQADPARRAYMDILEKSNDPSLTNIAQHGNHSVTRVVSVSAAASNASGSSIADGSIAGSGGRESLERVTEGVASTDFFREGVMSSSGGVGRLSPDSNDVSPGSASPLTVATPAEQSSLDLPLEMRQD